MAATQPTTTSSHPATALGQKYHGASAPPRAYATGITNAMPASTTTALREVVNLAGHAANAKAAATTTRHAGMDRTVRYLVAIGVKMPGRDA